MTTPDLTEQESMTPEWVDELERFMEFTDMTMVSRGRLLYLIAAARERDELREAAERLQNALDAPVEPYTVAHHTRRYDELRKARVGLRAALAHHDGSGEGNDECT